ncbi:nucleoside-diphosphate kinase [Candidatus Kinetoplastibacterium blastocrithidii TCC012E]|uniref:Nucleoside diphosphate kinase n=2 Tax=cellular organisms TaxID=131567 RepID=M1LBK8_9PROT|nr:nucleoside-diphosphate kinase [Candidatus Kinetoplastibacterium blastocrithidii]AFZ83701.1 nucleoside diphosphate kinase [Candidatus Kinetoplastibacterium blastocrithidii (ex Strigomonas culicis)]AGF49823.1 nucleoside-diphosphate kinase [Candidatus Kinetoplastibacterium blastocrithidii TCC012E]
MLKQRTLSIIKPDAIRKNIIGKIINRFEEAGLCIIAAKFKKLSRSEAESFYYIHKDRAFFKELIDFMVSGPSFIQVLEGDDAVQKNRNIMGNTDPKKADIGTIRADFADSIDANAVHGSDSIDNAVKEISFFFSETEIYAQEHK